ncbi:DUF4403 domain-containing protein [Gillisia limnaea]|uniref:DUF4403 family protein n=2 Tax=Gillisia TaxID=244698 RepID=H2C091_GILLR|nr:hypothetical protein Gilli_2895 [Gillisia limnaea DSM 15749]
MTENSFIYQLYRETLIKLNLHHCNHSEEINQRVMEQTENPSQLLNFIRLPIKIDYQVIETYLREKLTGEYISKTDKDGDVSNYAEIHAIALEKSYKEGYDIAVQLKFKTLTTIFKNKEGIIELYASLELDKLEQQLRVVDFTLNGTSNNWLFNNAIESIANTFMHEKIKNKMQFDLKSEIEKKLPVINEKMENPMEVSNGVYISGNLQTFLVEAIQFKENNILIFVDFEGGIGLDIKSLNF